MFSYFRGWKRKTSVVITLCACLVVGCWARSARQLDFLNIPLSELTNLALVSGGQSIGVLYGNNWSFTQKRVSLPGVTFDYVIIAPGYSVLRFQDLHWRVLPCNELRVTQSMDEGALIIPYWCVVMPLTLIATYLMMPTSTTFRKRDLRRDALVMNYLNSR